MKRDPAEAFGVAGVLLLALIVAAVIYALRPSGWVIPTLGH